MSDELLTVLQPDSKAAERSAPDLGEKDLRTLYAALVLTRTIDAHCEQLRTAGRLGFWVPSGPAAAVSAGAALAFHEGDWLYPSFRDAAAFLIRGGSVEALVAQLLASADDPQHGRQVAGHASLPDGRFVSGSGVLATQILHAAGTAMAMRMRGDDRAVLTLFGAASVTQGSYYHALELAARLSLPVTFVCRTDGSADTLRRAAGFGIEGDRVDGGDVLAVYKAVKAARQRSLAGEGPRFVEAVVQEDRAAEPASRLRPFLEYRGQWDPGQEEALTRRCEARVAAAIEVAESIGGPAVTTMLEDVYASPNWMLEEQAEQLDRQRGGAAGAGGRDRA